MSVSDKKYWSQRVQELANSVKPVSDTDFFSSDAYREFTENAAKDMTVPLRNKSSRKLSVLLLRAYTLPKSEKMAKWYAAISSP